MKKIFCPITGDTIIVSDSRGTRKRENYSEIKIILSDGSTARIPVSARAKKNLKKKEIDALTESLREMAKDAVNRSTKSEKEKRKLLSKIEKMKYTQII